MKIVLLGHDDFASASALNALIALCPKHDYRVFFSGALKASADVHPEMRHLADIDQVLFRQLMSQVDKAAPLRQARQLPAPNSAAGLETLAELQPDLIISIRYRRILHDAAIAIPKFGVLNLHSGILPDYKGVMATFWAMLNDETHIGSTLHYVVDSGIDTGPVLAISRIRADYTTSYLSNVLALYDEGCRKLALAVAEIDAGGKLISTPQKRGDGRYFSAPRAINVTDFLAKGLVLASDSDIERLGRPRNLR